MTQFQQNRYFRNNEGQFYKQRDESEEGEQIVIPDAGKTEEDIEEDSEFEGA